MNLEGKKIFILGCSYSHHDGPMSRDSDKTCDWQDSWPAMLSERKEVKFVANAAIPGTGVDTLYQRAKILLAKYGTPDLVIVQLTYPNRFLWSNIPIEQTLTIKKKNKKYTYFDHSERKWKQYAPLTPGNIEKPLYFINSNKQRTLLKQFFLTDYFNTCTEKEIAALESLFVDSDIKFFTYNQNVRRLPKRIKNSNNFLGDAVDWLGVPVGIRHMPNKYFIDSHLHLNRFGHQTLLVKLLEKL